MAEEPRQAVVEEVRSAILQGEYAPNQRLIETDLCERFSISRFSARAALQELSAQGLVEVERNRGARVRDAESSARREPSADGASITAKLRAAIVNGEFVAGQRLVETDLSADFSVSRASIRAALFELESEGLVERIPNRGARVRAVSLDEALEICEVRMGLEGLCAARAAERITQREIGELVRLGDEMRAALAAEDVPLYQQVNERLHERVQEISGQKTAAAMIRRLRAQNMRNQCRIALVPSRQQVSLGEHLAIIEGVTARDAEKARFAAEEHMRSLMAIMPILANGGRL